MKKIEYLPSLIAFVALLFIYKDMTSADNYTLSIIIVFIIVSPVVIKLSFLYCSYKKVKTEVIIATTFICWTFFCLQNIVFQ